MALTDIDRELLKRCVAEQPGAWREFVDRFVGLFVHVVRHTAHARSVRLGDDDVDDICAEIFLGIVANDYRLLRNFRGDSSLATYLAVVARRITVREISRRRMAEALGHTTASGASETAPRPAPGDGAAGRPASAGRVATRPAAGVTGEQQRIDDRDEVERLLAALPPREAELFRAFHLEGRTYEEIAARYGVPANTLGSTLSRTRERLRRLRAR